MIFFLASALILIMTTRFRLSPFLSLIGMSILVSVLTGRPFDGLESILAGMGKVIQQLGIIVACGCIIGMVLDRIEATSVMADDIIRITKNPLLALNFLGFMISVPVMCCILAYIILMPIAREISSKEKMPRGMAATSLSLGTLASYEFIYPAPGVYSAAKELGIVGIDVLALGLSMAILTSWVGYLYAKRCCGFGEVPETVPQNPRGKTSRLRAYPAIVVPLALIVLDLIFPVPVLHYLGEPNIALLIGVFIAFVAARNAGMDKINTWIREALKRSGAILLVLCAGGAFGSTLLMTGVIQEVGRMIIGSGLPGIFVPFLVAAGIQSAQGSRLVTFLIAPSIILPILPEIHLTPEIALMSMASGTFMISHANDAYFWTVIEFAEMTPSAGYKCYTMGGIVLGLTAFAMTAALHVSKSVF
jgi:GntP family gluconate:H+ symporter